MIVVKSILDKFENNKIWVWHIPLKDKDLEVLDLKDHKRVLGKINQKVVIRGAILRSEYPFVLVNQSLRNKLGLNKGDALFLTLEKDNSPYGHDVPEEFYAIFDEDLKAKAYFEALTIGKKRSLIYLIGHVKNTDSRIRKALALAEHLKIQKGELDFKLLNLLIKEYNQRAKI